MKIPAVRLSFRAGLVEIPTHGVALLKIYFYMAAEGNGYEEILYWYDRLMKHLGWTDKGKVLCGGVFNVGDIKGNSKLKDAYELGKSRS